jgi:hypothetical protein
MMANERVESVNGLGAVAYVTEFNRKDSEKGGIQQNHVNSAASIAYVNVANVTVHGVA